MDKVFYSYSPKNKEFQGEVIVYEIDGEWYPPENCTDVDPAENREGFVQVWNGEQWEYKSNANLFLYTNNGLDKSKVKWDYKADENELLLDHEASQEELIARFPDYVELLKQKEAEELAKRKEDKILSLKNERDAREIEPIMTEKGLFDFDTKSMNRLSAAITALDLLSEGTTIQWTLADDTEATCTALDLKNVFAAVASRSNALHVAYRLAKKAVNEATSMDIIESIKLDDYIEGDES